MNLKTTIRQHTAIAALALAAMAQPTFAQESPLVIARDIDVNSLDPARGWCDICQIYMTSVYEQLVTLDKDNKITPLLAESWDINADQTVFTFHLDPDATFSDGTPVEAKDVKWTFDRLKNLKSNASFLVDTVQSVEEVDPSTVTITLTGSNSEFMGQIAAGMLSIINSDVAGENGALSDETAAAQDDSEQWFLTHSAGSGPFVLTSYEPNAELRLARNDKYWRDAPALPGVIFTQAKDAVAQAQMLQSGAVDLALQVDPDTARTLEDSDVVVEQVPSYNYIYIALSPGAKSNQVDLTPTVREAISIAIDREALIDITLGGAGRPIATPIPLGFPGGDGHQIPAYDPDRAKQLLADAGHPDGFTIESVYPDANVYGVDFSIMMQKIQQDLRKVGITVELKPEPFATWREQVNTDHVPLTAVYYAPDFFGSSQYVDVFGVSEGSVWANRAGADTAPDIIDRQIDDLLTRALAAPAGQKADALWFEAGERMADNRIIIPMVSPDLIFAYRPNIEGVRYSACCALVLSEISN